MVSLCDVDSKQLSEAADIVASRQKSGKKPQHLSRLSRHAEGEATWTLCLIATPDHWHALAMIEAVKSGADVYCQKPISVDVAEGQAMLAAARKYKRVVQVGTQRRSTPHIVEAKEQFLDTGRLGKIAHGGYLLLLPHARHGESAGYRAAREPRLRNVDRPRAHAALQRAGPSARLARVHGIRQRHRRRHVHPHVRHDALDDEPRLAHADFIRGRHFRGQSSKANITDTQTCHVRISAI